jgi:hypothetical protein
MDQICIETALKELVSKNDIIVHIGTGNSGLASRFSSIAKWIHGVTIMPQEADASRSLALPNYSVSCVSKYGPSFLSAHSTLLGQAAFIVDNNPSTFCCCIRHYALMLQSYWMLLKEGGYVLTHKLGLGWYATPNLAQWGFTPQELAWQGDLMGFCFMELAKDVYALQKRDTCKTQSP